MNGLLYKGAKAARKLPVDFPVVEAKFLERKVPTIIKQFQILSSVIVNWDQTRINVVPARDLTLAFSKF